MRALVPVLLALISAVRPEDPGRALRDRDAEARLAAVEALGRSPGPDANRRLVAALRDRDPEVQLEAARALAGRDEPHAVAPLLALALDSPFRAVRLHAAAALRGAGKVERQLEKRLRGTRAESAREALAVLRGELSPDAPPDETVSWEPRDLPGSVAERRAFAIDAGLTFAELRELSGSRCFANRRAAIEAMRAVLDARVEDGR